MSSGKEKNNRRRANLHVRQDGRCFYCPDEIGILQEDKGSPVLEHYQPRCHGGRRLVLACNKCDRAKGMIPGPEFEVIIKEVVGRHGEFNMKARIELSGICKSRNLKLQAKHEPAQRGPEKTRERTQRIAEQRRIVVTDYPTLQQFLGTVQREPESDAGCAWVRGPGQVHP